MPERLDNSGDESRHDQKSQELQSRLKLAAEKLKEFADVDDFEKISRAGFELGVVISDINWTRGMYTSRIPVADQLKIWDLKDEYTFLGREIEGGNINLDDLRQGDKDSKTE